MGSVRRYEAERSSYAGGGRPHRLAGLRTVNDTPFHSLARDPVRFSWQMDAQRRFIVNSAEFKNLISPVTALALGKPWDELNAEFGLDPGGRVARALATRNTWTGIAVSWPLRDGTRRATVEMSGLPLFDTQRNFIGYRGFALCRDLERPCDRPQPSPPAAAETTQATGEITWPSGAQPVAARPEQPPSLVPALAAESGGPMPQSDVGEVPVTVPASSDRPNLRLVPPAKNVVPFPGTAPAEPRVPLLSAVEHKAFTELARQLSARLNGAVERSAPRSDAAEALPAFDPSAFAVQPNVEADQTAADERAGMAARSGRPRSSKPARPATFLRRRAFRSRTTGTAEKRHGC